MLSTFRKLLMFSLASVTAVVVTLAPVSSAHAAVPPSDNSWSYNSTQKKIVSTDGGASFTLKGGTAVTSSTGQPGVRFTGAPQLATSSTATVPTPGDQNFEWTLVFSVDKIYPKSSANLAQHGLWDGNQIKMQLDAKGVPQCVFNGTGGRLLLTSVNKASLVNGQSHTFSCWRTGNQLGATVDGISNSEYFAVGSIDPTGKPTIGSKSASATATDQFFGTFWKLTKRIFAPTGGS